jgi:hypothetical protein
MCGVNSIHQLHPLPVSSFFPLSSFLHVSSSSLSLSYSVSELPVTTETLIFLKYGVVGRVAACRGQKK